jgi:NTP pyrophosphatase (non-canonical NTP hydrolase)
MTSGNGNIANPQADAEGDPSPTLVELQRKIDEWIRSVGVRYFNEMTNLAQLMEEVGELARIFSRTYGEQSWKDGDAAYNLADEMADVLFVLVCLANQTGVDLTAAMERNLAKKTQRDATRHQNNPKL